MKKIIATLIAAAVISIALAPAAFAAPACPLKSAPAVNPANLLEQVQGTEGNDVSAPNSDAISNLLKGINNDTTAPATLQQLIEKLGINMQAGGLKGTCPNK